MPHIRGAQQQGEQVIIISRGDGLPCGQQVHHLVQQLGDHIPFPQGFVRVGQIPAGPQVIGQLLQGLLRPQALQKVVNLRRHGGGIRVAGTVHKFLHPRHQKAAGFLGALQVLLALFAHPVGVALRVAGKGFPPVLRMQRPGIGIVFQCALAVPVHIHQTGFQQAQQRRGGQTAAQQIQRCMDRTGRGGVFRRCGFITEQRDILQPEFIPDLRQVLVDRAADHRHFVIRHTRTGTRFDGCRHGLGLRLAAVRLIIGNSRGGGVHLCLRRIGRIRQQKAKLRQHRGIFVAHILGQADFFTGHPRTGRHGFQGIGHPPRTAEHAIVRLVRSLVTAQAYRYIGNRQHGRQHGALGVVERIKFINVHRAARKKGLVQAFGRQLHTVAGVHGRLGQQGFIGSKNQGQFPQLIFVRTGGVGIIRQGLRADARAFQLADGFRRLLAERSAAALAAVIHHLVHHFIHSAAHQHGASGLAQRGHRRTAIAAQQGFGQRGKGIALHIGRKFIPQCVVKRTFGRRCKLLRHNQDAALPAARTLAQFFPQAHRFSAARRAKDQGQHGVPLSFAGLLLARPAAILSIRYFLPHAAGGIQQSKPHLIAAKHQRVFFRVRILCLAAAHAERRVQHTEPVVPLSAAQFDPQRRVSTRRQPETGIAAGCKRDFFQPALYLLAAARMAQRPLGCALQVRHGCAQGLHRLLLGFGILRCGCHLFQNSIPHLQFQQLILHCIAVG